MSKEFDVMFAANLIGSGGGGKAPTLIEKDITANGTYIATNDNADGYSTVDVDVPNTYTVGDEGKVVDNGALVAQTAYPTEITANDTYDTTLYNSVTVNVSGGGGSGVEEKDVNFYDYDGTVLYSYTKAEFLALTEMPANPSHDGLTAQGWNWSYQDAIDYVSNYGVLDVGQMYVTNDGATRIYITLNKDTLNPYLGLYCNNTITIDWGDNSPLETVTIGSSIREIFTPHTYASAGDYVISIAGSSTYMNFPSYNGGTGISSAIFSIDGTTNSDSFKTNKRYLYTITKIEMGNYTQSCVASILGLRNLKSITMPSNCLVGNNNMGSTKLKHITVPIINKDRTNNQYTFSNNYCLETISLPKGFFSDTGLDQCPLIKHLTTSCEDRDVMYMLGSNTPRHIYMKYITIADNSTATLHSGYLSDSGIEYFVIPEGVTTISNYFFNVNNNLRYIKFKPTTPPTVSTNSFYWIPTDCIFYVPALVSNLYMTGTNYRTTYNYIGYATYSSGDTLPTLTTDETYTLTWYATVEDAIAQTNPITTGNGNEVYSRATAVV